MTENPVKTVTKYRAKHKITEFLIGPAKKIWRIFEENDWLAEFNPNCEEQASSSESTLKILLSWKMRLWSWLFFPHKWVQVQGINS